MYVSFEKTINKSIVLQTVSSFIECAERRLCLRERWCRLQWRLAVLGGCRRQMSLRLFILLVSLYSFSFVCAQSRQERWTLTPRVGLNSSSVTGLKWYSNDGGNVTVVSSMKVKRKLGVTVGADVEYRAGRRLGVSFGWFYSDEGYLYDGKGEDGNVYVGGAALDGNISVHLHHFNFPLMLNVYVLPGLAVKAGVQVDGLISGRQKYKGESSNVVLNSINSVGLCVPVGLSYDFGAFSADCRYVFGVSNLCDAHLYNELGASWHTNSLWVTLGYRINL